MVTDPETLEFWPEYDSGPLWAADGEPVPLDELPLPDDLRSRLMAWNDEFEDAKLPFDQHDEDWLQLGRVLLVEVRRELEPRYKVSVTEPWWELRD